MSDDYISVVIVYLGEEFLVGGRYGRSEHVARLWPSRCMGNTAGAPYSLCSEAAGLASTVCLKL